MRIIRISLIILLVVVTFLFGYTEITQRTSGKQEGPRIQCDTDIVQVSVNHTAADLLAGVTASDAQDGDLTGKVIVGGISKLITNNTAKVTYLVFDSDSNMASIVRYAQYTDYQRPRLELQKPLVFSSTASVSVSDAIRAHDAIDGDLSKAVRISTLSRTEHEDIYRVVAQVTNSMGDTARVELPVIIDNTTAAAPVITLKEQLVYLEAGSEFDAAGYVASVKVDGREVSVSDVAVTHSVDTNTSGSYWVFYSYTSGEITGFTILTVVIP